MNLLTKQVYGNKAVVGFNTYIGGVSATISTDALLATKLRISVGRIENFTIVGSDIKCNITGSYALVNDIFSIAFTPTTYYLDADYLVTSIGDRCFKNTDAFENTIADFQNATSIGVYAFMDTKGNSYLLKNATTVGDNALRCALSDTFYIPSCTSLGSTVGNNNVFFSIKSGARIYAHPSLATNNGGAPDGDLAYAITQGAVVNYVTNYTVPSNITDLSAGTIYSKAIQLNFTAPSSTNAIDYYECYADGILKNRTSASGGFITGLTASTSYAITVIAVDIFYNKSVVSNSVTQSTNTTSAFPTSGLVSYYKLDSNSNDSYGSNNGTDTSVSYVSGKISNAGSYNGTTSKTVIGNPANLQLSTLSVSLWVKSTGAGVGYRGLFYKYNAYNLLFNNNILTTYSYGSPVGDKSTGVNISDGVWRHVVMVQQGGVTNGTKIYINGILVLTTTVGVVNQSSNLELGTWQNSNSGNYQLDELAIYNRALTQTEIDLLYNGGNGITL